MRITFLLPSYMPRPSGGTRVVYEYADHLAARGHEVTLVHPLSWSTFSRWRKIRRHLRSILIRPSIRWHSLDSRVKVLFPPEPDPRVIPDSDFIVATAWETAEVVAGLPRSAGKKLYLIQHFEDWAGPTEQVAATWRMPMHKVVISQWLLEKGRELGVPESDMTHIPNGINTNRFKSREPIESRPARVAMLYADTEWKGGKDGIAAMEQARQRVPGFTAVLFGVSKQPRSLPSWIQYVRDPEQESLVDDIYSRSSIFLCASWTEGFGLPAAESMACGCAVVTTDNGGCRDYAMHGQTAFVVPPRRPELLAEVLVELLQDDALRIRIAHAGHEKIMEFSWDRSTALFEDLLLRLSKD